MRAIALGMLVAACGGGSGHGPIASGPVVESVSPLAGPWGTEITITGSGFGGVAGTGLVAFDSDIGSHGFVIDTWHDTKIEGRVAFPATGSMTLHAQTGDADLGTFATDMTWQPSNSFDAAQLVDSRVLASGDLAAVFHQYQLANQAVLVVFTGAHAGAYRMDNVVDPADMTAAIHAHVIDADAGGPLVVATKHDGSVASYAVSSTSLASSATGLSGAVIAVGRDGSGSYAWIANGSGLVRARPGSSWTMDRGPIALPYAPLDGAIASDGTLLMVVSEPASGSDTYLSVQTLGPTDTAFGAAERANPTVHTGAITGAQIALASDGVHAMVTTSDGTRVRTAAGTWSDAPTIDGLVQLAWVGTTLAAVTNNATNKTTSLVPDVTAPANAQVIPVWPVLSSGLVVDGAGGVHPLVASGDTTYALTHQ